MEKSIILDQIAYSAESVREGNDLLMLVQWFDMCDGLHGAATFLAGELELGSLSDRLTATEQTSHIKRVGRLL